MSATLPELLTREHVLRALSDLDAGMMHPVEGPVLHELVDHGKRYAAQAVLWIACRHALGRIPRPDEVSIEDGPGQTNRLLRQLGFTVEPSSETTAPVTRGKDWSEQEVRLLVVDYFAMLESELLGRRYVKSEHSGLLRPQLTDRSKASVEFKHANVSGVLVEMGLPYIEGYKPRSNYQALLATEVENFLGQNPNLLDRLAASRVLNPTEAVAIGTSRPGQLIEAAPERIYAPAKTAKPWLSRRGKQIDFVARDAANRRLGELGEQFVFDLEQQRLKSSGRDDLAHKVTWASREYGDGLGYDILSYNETNDTERMIEVKSTGLGKYFPFLVTDNEVRCSEDIPTQFQLFRVFDLSRTPRVYILNGSLRQVCDLAPVIYRASM